MSPSWLIYASAGTAIVGALTGIAGAIMGYVSYRRSSKLKALDLRLELRKLEADIDQELRSLRELIEYANESRFAVASATGVLNSGAIDAWKQQVQADRSAVANLENSFHYSADSYVQLSYSALETKLVEAHILSGTVNRLAAKYRGEVAADDKDREHIRAGVGSRHLSQRR